MSTHRLAALKHREVLFDRHIDEELTHSQPDTEAMHFFETQRNRIHDLIVEIESNAVTAGDKTPLEAKSEDDATRLEMPETLQASA